ncbi:MAG: Lrp/AsnC family transcriptional regulator [Rubrivivax sp.]|nr:Lrp/AsnC family transcriptional regulator [Rubrivivax sp.]HRD96878.1 Lrp/AsnC family transcriptional regulator [Rubrivivax sp.]
MDTLDQQLIALLKVNARLPVVKMAKALGCARSTVQLRLKALEESGAITGYTVSLARRRVDGVNALVLIAVASQSEPDVVHTLSRRHEVSKLYSVSGRYDLCAMVHAESTEEIEQVINRVRAIKGVADTLTTMLLSTKVDRPE